jgi:flagellar biosynthetic protein FlhB
MSAGERTEAPTPRRLQELRARGQAPHSADLPAALALVVALLALQYFGGDVAGRLQTYLRVQAENLSRPDLTIAGVMALGHEAGLLVLLAMGPLALILLVMSVVTGLGQTGLVFSARLLAPDVARLNPIRGLQRLFGLQGLVHLLKTLLKLALPTLLLYRSFVEGLPDLMALGTAAPALAVPRLVAMLASAALQVAGALLVIAVLDYGYARWQFQRSARMTRDELKEELRQSDGAPEMRAKIRQRQRKLASRRMMAAVPTADVVLTNPTHLAVALVYRGEEMAAPRVVAKGAGLLATRIRQIAEANGVPVLENKPLARALYQTVEVDEQIPRELFDAVAQVLAYIYSLRSPRTTARRMS